MFHWRDRALGIQYLTLLAVSLAGLAAIVFPFLIAAMPDAPAGVMSRSIDASLLVGSIVGCALVIAVGELARQPAAGSLARSIAVLGALVAIDASLRLVPSFLGASPIFALIVLVGYVFGSRFGFVMGALTLLLSAAITAGIGPWLPFQMLCAGWTGVAAGWLPRPSDASRKLAIVVAFGAGSGFVYGALMNLYSWPLAAPGAATDAGLYWNPSLSLGETIERYAVFYLATSLVHDATRAAATAALLLIAGGPLLRLLERFKAKAHWRRSRFAEA